MAKVKSYLNPNIPKPKPGNSGDATRYKTQPVKPDTKLPPVRRRGPGGGRGPVGGPKQPAPPRKERQLPRKVLSVISKRKPAPKNKGGR